MKTFSSILIYLFPFFIVTYPSKCNAQTVVDSILLELEELESNYEKKKKELFVKLNHERFNNRKVWFQGMESLGRFYLKENIMHLLDSIDYEVLSLRENPEGEWLLPYYTELLRIGSLHESGNWVLIPFILSSLDEDKTSSQLFFYGQLFRMCYRMGNLRVAKCIREMAHSISGVSKRKENLLKIANHLD